MSFCLPVYETSPIAITPVFSTSWVWERSICCHLGHVRLHMVSLGYLRSTAKNDLQPASNSLNEIPDILKDGFSLGTPNYVMF